LPARECRLSQGSAAAAIAAVCGFYDVAAIAHHARQKWDLPASTPELTAIRVAYQHWLRLMVLGARPWLVIGLVTGLGAGYLGHLWTVRGRRFAAALAGLALIGEPALYVAKLSPDIGWGSPYDYRPANLAIWGIEALIGVVAYASLHRRAAAPEPTEPLAEPSPV
jgi:hypothetical protein